MLRAGGHVLKVEPGRRHLYELKELLYDRVIENEAEAVRYPSFALEKEWLIEDVIEVRGAEHIEALFQMDAVLLSFAQRRGPTAACVRFAADDDPVPCRAVWPLMRIRCVQRALF